MKKLTSFLLTAVLSVVASVANAWTIHADFDGGELGARADRSDDGFHGAGGNSRYTDEVKLKNNSAKIAIKEGVTGYGTWGGEFRYPEVVRKGQTIWFLVHAYMPEDFDHYSYGAGNRLKFLRIQTAGDNGNMGYNDLYFNTKGSSVPFRWIYEGELHWVDVGQESDKPKKEVWESYEMAVTLDNVPVSEGGSAKVRIWKNGVLLKEILNRKTLKGEDGYSSRALLFTYWNGGAPKDQHMYVDEITITTDEPEGRDAQGNPYIGGYINVRPLMTPD